VDLLRLQRSSTAATTAQPTAKAPIAIPAATPADSPVEVLAVAGDWVEEDVDVGVTDDDEGEEVIEDVALELITKPRLDKV
jgi:hypothetical protein